MNLINANNISFRCSYNGDCTANEEQCKKCSDYVCDYETIQNLVENNDYCVWTKHKNPSTNYSTTCNEDFVPRMHGYKFCPYCGKQIKYE